MDTSNRRGDRHKFYSSSSSSRNYGRHCYHPYRRSDKGYFLNEFKKAKPPTFDGDLKKSWDEKSWLLAMNKFFELHEYTENMKASIAIFNLKGKVYIWWEDVKWVRDIKKEELIRHESKRPFRKKYLLERYYDIKSKEFYELKIGSVKDEEYTTEFLELLRYVPYIKYEKAKFQIFFSGFFISI